MEASHWPESRVKPSTRQCAIRLDDKYPAKAHARNVAKALGASRGAVFLPGRPSRYFQDSDMGPTFRQWRYFFYLSGVDEPDCNLIYDIQVDQLILYVPDEKDYHEVVWNGAGLTRKEALEKYDCDAVDYHSELADLLKKFLLSKIGPLFILHPDDLRLFDIPNSDLIDYVSLMPAMNFCRVIKDDHEVQYIREANRISGKAHTEVLRAITTLKNETSVEAIFKGVCIDHGAKHQAYGVIAASGKNAATLHYMKNDEPLKGRELMCLDAGCEWKNYACDVTRTFPLSGDGWPSAEAKAIYSLVDKMQHACITQIRPGVLYRDLFVLAHHVLVEGLLELGIFHNGTVEEIVKAGTSLSLFPHGLGHHVGLEVHDVFPENDVLSGCLRPLGLSCSAVFYTAFPMPKPFVKDIFVDPAKELHNFKQKYGHLVNSKTCHAPVDLASGDLRTGMVVTVEPGIYFNEFALEKIYLPSPVHSKYINKQVLKRFMSVGGVRIEDDILVLENGCENLTTAPKAEDMLRYIKNGQNAEEIPQSTTFYGNPHSIPRSLRHFVHIEPVGRHMKVLE